MKHFRRKVSYWIDDHIDEIDLVFGVIAGIFTLVINWGLFIWALTVISEYRDTPLVNVPFGKAVVVAAAFTLIVCNTVEAAVRRGPKARK
ncbi:MAG TPA: hypothetical protein VIY48_10440 [Candidatus Paceibacterota bacterium]